MIISFIYLVFTKYRPDPLLPVFSHNNPDKDCTKVLVSIHSGFHKIIEEILLALIGLRVVYLLKNAAMKRFLRSLFIQKLLGINRGALEGSLKFS